VIYKFSRFDTILHVTDGQTDREMDGRTRAISSLLMVYSPPLLRNAAKKIHVNSANKKLG